MNRVVAVALLALIALTLYFWFHEPAPKEHALRMTAGDPLNHRYQLALLLKEEAAKHDLQLEIVGNWESQDALTKLATDELDIALTLGDFDIPDEHLRQVAVLNREVMHLFVRPELIDGGLKGLRGHTLNLNVPGSNTHKMSHRMLHLVGLESGRDYTEVELPHAEIMTRTADELPDGIFVITSLPWGEVGDRLVGQLGYRLMELPYGDAVSLRNPSVRDAVIPAYSYGINPPVPDRPLHTLGQQLLVVARRETPSAAIERLMTVIFESEFGRRARLSTLSPLASRDGNEFPMHAGTLKYLHRNEPLIKADSIDKLENLRSFLVSAALACFLFWRWQKRRNMIGFESYIDAVTELELAAMNMDRSGPVDFAELKRLRGRLTELKTEALEREAEGVLSGDDQMSSFLTHVSDVRNYLDSMLSREPPPSAPIRRADADPDLETVQNTERR
ncbi:MAG TPA: TAXI family TRAP transporter solute-binding subunit [Pirellulales bacterium]|nr:TAXI family TRAP transporter solute-binding subunit [Pirellulales bacterium]